MGQPINLADELCATFEFRNSELHLQVSDNIGTLIKESLIPPRLVILIENTVVKNERLPNPDEVPMGRASLIGPLEFIKTRQKGQAKIMHLALSCQSDDLLGLRNVCPLYGTPNALHGRIDQHVVIE